MLYLTLHLVPPLQGQTLWMSINDHPLKKVGDTMKVMPKEDFQVPKGRKA